MRGTANGCGMSDEKNTVWKRQAVASCNIEITEKTTSAVRIGYLSVAGKLEVPRNLMGAGYHDQRREWLGVIADALEKGYPIPEADFLEVVAMLKKTADGEPPEKAFGLNNSRGRKKETERLNRLRKIAIEVYAFSKDGHPLSVEPSAKIGTKASAYSMAAQRCKVKERLARDAWDLYKDVLLDFYKGAMWQESLPSKDKLTNKKRK